MDLPQAALRMDPLNIGQSTVICTLFLRPPSSLSSVKPTHGEGVIIYVTAQLISSVMDQNIPSENLISSRSNTNLCTPHRVQSGYLSRYSD
jgi:hypothetical protein